MTSKRHWFAARILIEALHPDEQDVEPLFEERIVLFRGDNEDEARKRARIHGESSQHEYKNASGKRVVWKFYDVLDVQELLDEQLRDGAEVFSGFLTKHEVEHLLQPIGTDK